jgi:hypothetical protein
MKLTMQNHIVHEGEVYHKSHAPTLKATVVAENSEQLRVREQSVRQSKVAYTKQYNTEVKGSFIGSNAHISDGAKPFSPQRGADHGEVVKATEYETADSAPVVVSAREPEPEPEPEAPPAGDGKVYVAEYDYEAGDGDEVGFSEGDELINVSPAGDGWVNATNPKTGVTGMCPSNYLVEKADAPAAAEPEPEPEPEPAAPEPEPEAAPEPEPEAAPEPEPEAAPEPEPEPAAAAGPQWKAEYDYDAGDADEVSFKENDVMINVEPAGDGWVTATNQGTGLSGMCPSNYLVEA